MVARFAATHNRGGDSSLVAAIHNRVDVLGLWGKTSGRFEYLLLTPDPTRALVPKRLPSVLVSR
jgi:hypothetical protein